MGQFLTYFANHKVLHFHDVEDYVDDNDDAEYAEVYEATSVLLESGSHAYEKVVNYRGNGDLIRKALNNSNDEEKQTEYFQAMFTNIKVIKSIYDLSSQVNDSMINVLDLLLHTDGNIRNKPVLMRIVADVFDFISKFDWAKMQKPSIQNDFSFYRRSLEKQSKSVADIPVDDIEAGQISFFVAQATPFTSSLISYLQERKEQFPELIEFLAEFANICCDSVAHKSNHLYKEELFAAMTISIILYDSMETTHGAFEKSAIEIKKCINQLKHWENEERKSQYLNSLKYSTRTFHNAPNNIQKMLESSK